MNDHMPLILQAAGKAALPAEQDGTIKDSVEVAKAAELPFTAEGRFLSGSLYVSDGILTLPRELKEVRPSAARASSGRVQHLCVCKFLLPNLHGCFFLSVTAGVRAAGRMDVLLTLPGHLQVLGRDLHLTVVVGAHNLHASADELSLDTAWVGTDTPPEAARQRLPASKEQPSTSGAAEGGGADRVALLPSESWPLDPTIISIRSEHLEFEAAGWRRADGRLLLRRPAKAQLRFTPALAECGPLARSRVPLQADM